MPPFVEGVKTLFCSEVLTTGQSSTGAAPKPKQLSSTPVVSDNRGSTPPRSTPRKNCCRSEILTANPTTTTCDQRHAERRLQTDKIISLPVG